MEVTYEDHKVAPELYFLIAKFLSDGPLKETGKTLLKELKSVEVLPRRLDWEGNEHAQSYEELCSQFKDMPSSRLLEVCTQTLKLATQNACLPRYVPPADDMAALQNKVSKVTARLSLLGEGLARDKPKYSWFRQDHNLARRVSNRELGTGPPSLPGGRGGAAMLTSRLLTGLQLQRRTLGHLSAVYCVLFDCTGRYVVTGADDQLVKLWSAHTGRLLHTLRGASAEVTDVCLTSDCRLLACGSVRRAVCVWSLRGGGSVELAAHQGTITAVHWAPQRSEDIRWLVSTSTDGSVAFWSISMSGQLLAQPVQYIERMRPGACHMICAAWSPGGAFLAAGSADHHVRVYLLEPGCTPRRICESAGHTEAVDSLAWSRCRHSFVSGGKDGRAAVWSLQATTWRYVSLVCDGTSTDNKRLKVTMVQWDVSDAYIVTAVSDCTIRVWCARTYVELRKLKGHTDSAYVLESHPILAGVFMSAGHDGQLIVWDVTTPAPLAKFTNEVAGQNPGALYDARWGGGAHLAATDALGHLLVLGLGVGADTYRALPEEMFLCGDYRPVIRDASGVVVTEEPRLLVDAEGAPHPEWIQALAFGANPDEPWSPESQYRNMIQAPPPGWLDTLVGRNSEQYTTELAWYSREMRRRPLMISTGPSDTGARRGGRVGRARVKKTLPTPEVQQPSEPEPESDASSDVSLDQHSSSSSSHSLSISLNSSSKSSQYSDWAAGEDLAPPRRTRRRQTQPVSRYSPSTVNLNKKDKPTPTTNGTTIPATPAIIELPEVYRPGEWITAVSPRKAPYFPQLGDQVVYFRLGHQKYFEAVTEKDVYKVQPGDKPWERMEIKDAEFVKVIAIRYDIRPPRVASLRMQVISDSSHNHCEETKTFTVRYHDMPDVIDFMVPIPLYEASLDRVWDKGDRFRCMIDDFWWSGVVLDGTNASSTSSTSSTAASHFLSLKVQWDNGELERLSPWDLENIDPDRQPTDVGGAVPVLRSELAATLRRAGEWTGGASVAVGVGARLRQVMTLSAAEPFVAPVDLQQYPSYALVVPYPIDLSTIKARFEHLFYRRPAAAQFDVRHIAANAELYNTRGAPIVRQARLITALVLDTILNWENIDVIARYHELAANYQSSDDEQPLSRHKSSRKHQSSWQASCQDILDKLMASSDAEPFKEPVDITQAPDYHLVVSHPMDLGTISHKLSCGSYSRPQQFGDDCRLVFGNSRRYNTHKGSRIYGMTVRLSALFSALWSQRSGQRRMRARRRRDVDPLSSSEEEVSRTRDRWRSRGSDSLDSDIPLTVHKKGKGIGKKSKRVDPIATTSLPPTAEYFEEEYLEDEYEPEEQEIQMSASETEYTVEVLDPEVEHEDSSSKASTIISKRKRRKISTDSSVKSPPRRRRRSRVTRTSHSSGSSSTDRSLQAARSDRSDHSYRPRFDTDDDTPLLTYRERQEQNGFDEPGPSNCRRSKKSRARLRRRRAPPRYHDSSSAESLAAISKRRVQRTARPSTSTTPAHNTDHNYFNGNGHIHPVSVERIESRPDQPLSISSRGRVRKLTAKARGLLRE